MVPDDTSSPTYSPTDPDTPSPTDAADTPSPTDAAETPSPTDAAETPGPTTESPVSETPTYSPTEPLICQLSPEDRAEQFRQLALSVTDDGTLSDPDSSQAKALDWLLNEDVLDPPLCPDD